MLKKIVSKELNSPHRKTKILFRSPNHYPDYDTEDEVTATDVYKNCVFVADDALEVEQKGISPFFTRGTHEIVFVFFYRNDIFSIRC